MTVTRFLSLSYLTSRFLLCVLFSKHSFLIFCSRIFIFICRIPIIVHVYCVSCSVSYLCRKMLSLGKLLMDLIDDRQRVQSDYTTILLKEINILLLLSHSQHFSRCKPWLFSARMRFKRRMTRWIKALAKKYSFIAVWQRDSVLHRWQETKFTLRLACSLSNLVRGYVKVTPTS